MANVQRIPVGRKPGERTIELPEQVSVELGDLAGKVKEGLLAFAVGVGLEVFKTLLEMFRPTVTRASASDFNAAAVQAAGQATQTCRYTQTSYAAGNREGSANPSNSGFAVTSTFDTDVIGELQTGLFGGNLQGKVWAEAGVAIQLATNWPQPSSVTVTYPWEVKGFLSVETDANNLPFIGGVSSATASYLSTAHLKQGDLGADPKVLVNEIQAPGPFPGTESKIVQAAGTETMTVATPPWPRVPGVHPIRIVYERQRTTLSVGSRSG